MLVLWYGLLFAIVVGASKLVLQPFKDREEMREHLHALDNYEDNQYPLEMVEHFYLKLIIPIWPFSISK